MAISKYKKVAVFATQKQIDSLDKVLSLPLLLAMVRKVELTNPHTQTFRYVIEVKDREMNILFEQAKKRKLQKVELA